MSKGLRRFLPKYASARCRLHVEPVDLSARSPSSVSSDKNLLNYVLDQWPEWHCELSKKPQLIRSLQGGYTNASFLLQAEEKQFVLRLHHGNANLLGIDRVREAKILKHLSPLGIAPQMHYLASDHGYSVLGYIDGEVWSEAAFTSPTNRRLLSDTIQRFQQVSPILPRFDYVKHVSAYWQRYATLHPTAAIRDRASWQRFLQDLQEYQARRYSYKLTHHDITAANIIETVDGITIIDWEYAALGFDELDMYSLERATRNPYSRLSAHKSSKIISELNEWMMALWWGIT